MYMMKHRVDKHQESGYVVDYRIELDIPAQNVKLEWPKLRFRDKQRQSMTIMMEA